VWREVLERRRWLFSKREADAADLSDDAISWLREFAERDERPPLLLWVHYMDPHSLYILHREYLDQLGISGGAFFSASRRYDTEIAHADHHIGRLLEAANELLDPANTIVIFTSDHGESLGDHGYWGHGRHVYENVLRIPLSFTWRGHLQPGTIGTSALIVDIAPTLLSLAGVGDGHAFQGFDWAPVLRGEAAEPDGRVTYFQGHRGTVDPKEDPSNLRRKGLLEVGMVQGTTKEVYVVRKDERRSFDVVLDPEEQHNRVAPDSEISAELRAWFDEVTAWLEQSGDEPPPGLSQEDADKLRALGYLE
jgi:arylsulfatase A-like enzyme